ncbi:MAG: GGDEF domain-containing protein [Eubacteriales bacterium]|nr:GGDEF domain-containing protein [Eubacteriales bacterium]
MCKKIAIFLGEVVGNLQEEIMKLCSQYANQKGYGVISFCTYGSYNEDFLYAEGEKACISLPDMSGFDGVIVTEDVFNIPGMGDELYQVLKKDATCPVVYMRTKREGFYSVLSENTVGIEMMTKHFIEHHGFRDICFMSGKKGSQDSVERLQGFLNAMEEYQIPVTEHMIFHGDYWREKGKEALSWFMEGRETYPQVIICANDYMALSICEELREHGVRVPEDVCVSGFDYVIEAKQYHPSLTSMMVDFDKMSKKAVEIIDRVNSGKSQETYEYVTPKLKLHKSCGCGKQIHVSQVSELVDEKYQNISKMKDIMLSTTEYQDAFDEEEYLWITEKYGRLFNTDNVYLCMCDTEEEGYAAVENASAFSEQMILKRVFHGEERAEKKKISFPRKDILPKDIWKQDEIQNFMIFVLHFKNNVYGYLVAEFPQKGWFDIFTQGYIMTLANAIENASVQKKLEDLEKIKALYQKDSLTGLYNRRGFDKLIRDRMIAGAESKNVMTLVSIDMDGLKYVNDNFGHMEGDNALKLFASALKKSIGKDEFCARVGGDEFAAFLTGASKNREARFLKNLEKELQKVNSQQLPYQVDASVGTCVMNEGDLSFADCVRIADRRMYENKNIRKAQGKAIR